MNNKYSHQFFKMISMFNSKMLCRKFAELNLHIYRHKIEKGQMYIIDLKKFGLENDFTHPELMINHWTIRDIIIMICKRPKFDHKSYIRQEITSRELLIIIGYFLDYENNVSGDYVEGMSSQELHYMLYGLALNQFPSQVSNGLYNTLRNHIIFNKINTEENNLIDVEIPFKNRFNMSYNEYITIVMMIYAKSQQGIYLLLDLDSTIDEWESKIKNFEQKYIFIIDSFCENYISLESLDFHLIRYLYPIIDDTENTYVIDPFMLERKMYEGAYWVLRDYYNSKESETEANYFPNKFGILFESYVDYLLKHSSIKSNSFNYVKLTEKNKNEYFDKEAESNKYVDFLIETSKYQIVVECKSAIQLIRASDLYRNYSAVEKFFERNILEACVQLENTSRLLTDTQKQRINIILTYQESYQKNHTKEIYFQNHKINKYGNYLIVDIVELEKILNVVIEDYNKAIEVLESFINSNIERPLSEGLDLEFHLSKFKCSKKSIVKDFEEELKDTILKH